MAIKLKQILTQQDIDELREGDVVNLEGIASPARFCGATVGLKAFSYRVGNSIFLILPYGRDLKPGTSDDNRGKILLPDVLSDPLIYTKEDNGHLYSSRDKELKEVGIYT